MENLLRPASAQSIPVRRVSKTARDSASVLVTQKCKTGSHSVVRAHGSHFSTAARRRVLVWFPASLGLSVLQNAQPVQASMMEDLTRKALRPDLDYMQAVIMLLDARSVLREVEV